MTNADIRARILEVADKVLIKRNGEIHAYGTMPNTNQSGWYLYGTRDIVAREFEAEDNEQKIHEGHCEADF
jgi:ABC-type multidrug transport system ATPase subunit